MIHRPLFLSGSPDDTEDLYAVTVDAPKGEPLLGLIVDDNWLRVIAWPDGVHAETLTEVIIPEGAEARAIADERDRFVTGYNKWVENRSELMEAEQSGGPAPGQWGDSDDTAVQLLKQAVVLLGLDWPL